MKAALAYPKPGASTQGRRRRRRLARYREIKEERADERICGYCGKTGLDLEPHHKAGRDGDRLARPEDIELVHRGCHDEIHANPQRSYETGHLIRRNAVRE